MALQQTLALPRTVEEWTIQARRYHQHPDPVNIGINDIGKNAFRSASKMSYDDWLLLKIVWPDPLKVRPTHDDIFGHTRGSRLRDAAKKQLDRCDWMKALLAGDDNPLSWSHMAAWKQSANDVSSSSPAVLDLSSDAMYDEADPFRLVVEPPAARDRAIRARDARHARELAAREARGGIVTDSSESSAERAGSVYSSFSAQNRASPPRSQNVGSSSGSPGSLGGQGAAASSPGSGASAEAKLINKHRPDEALINMSLVLLLQGVCMPLLQDSRLKGYDWTILHKQFSVSQPQANSTRPNEKKNILTAKTDGCLQVRKQHQDRSKSDTLSIIEVKPYRRNSPQSNAKTIRIQEGAEMAAWISSEALMGMLPSGPNVYRRLLISQDFDEVFLTIAEFDDLYVRHIRGNSTSWPMDRLPQVSPSRDPRPRSPISMPRMPSDEEDRGRPREKEDPKGKKGFSLKDLKSVGGSSKSSKEPSIASSSMGKAAVTSLPTRERREVPHRQARQGMMTSAPGRDAASRSSASQKQTPQPLSTPGKAGLEDPEVPQAPWHSRAAAQNPKSGTDGFLFMKQFQGFNIENPGHVRELALLLLSLTDELCSVDARLRFSKTR